jgi:hypothetical protein
MSLLSTVDLTMMRDIIDEMMPDTCSILSESLISDGQGGVTSTWGTVAIDVPCRIDLPTGRQFGDLINMTGALRQKQQFILSLPYDTAIVAGNRVESGGGAYTVINSNTGVSWKAVARATLEYIESIAPTSAFSLNFSLTDNSQYLGVIY